MVFSFADDWHIALAKCLIIVMAIWIMERLISQSLWNFGKRGVILSAAIKQRKFWRILGNTLAVLANLLFIWTVVQGVVVLIFGYFSVSPNELIGWRFQEFTLIGVLLLVWLYIGLKGRQIRSIGVKF